MARTDAKHRWEQGGLGFPDIESSWTAFKMSWFRRLLYSNGTWTSILASLLKQYVSIDSIYEFILKISTDDFKCIAKNLKNDFWKDCVSAVAPLMRAYIEKLPEELINCRIWGNHLLKYRNRILRSGDLPTMASKYQFIYELLKIDDNGNTIFISYDEIRANNDNIHEAEFISLRYIIKQLL